MEEDSRLPVVASGVNILTSAGRATPINLFDGFA